ncbi:hypothetical protein [Salinisphaera sp. T31B1]|uniref:TA system antitoxin ParD family protein n=1 Tax=Salinisphaera sp. T31B1 TaxID=727963 RepID=UPI00333FDB14
MTSDSVRISRDIVSAARREAQLVQRPLQAQLEHWARIGRAIEGEASFRKDQVDRALRGQLNPDELGRYERAVYDAEHEALMMRANEDEKVWFKQLEKRLANAGIHTDGIGT